MEDRHYITTAAGVRMPKIIYGTAWKREHTTELVLQAVQAGFRGIDTACQPKHYAEASVGEALASLKRLGVAREELFIQTKFTPLEGQDPNNIPYDKNATLPEQVEQSFNVSKQNLKTKYVDSLVLHSPLFPFSRLKSVWEAMESIYKAGGARQLGISNCYDLALLKRLYEEADVKPAVVQNRFCADTGYDVELRRWCDEQGIIYQGFWTLTANPHLLESRTVLLLARKYRKTPPQILFHCLSRFGIVPLSGTTSRQHMKEDLESLDIELSIGETESVRSLILQP